MFFKVLSVVFAFLSLLWLLINIYSMGRYWKDLTFEGKATVIGQTLRRSLVPIGILAICICYIICG